MGDIWDEFEKIAIEQGLVNLAEDKEDIKQNRNSLSDDAIRLLYGVEPESIFSEKDKNIIEIAHPETAVVGRAYDAMNAVVENEQQRHDMMTYIALRMPNGQLTQRRYVAAKQDLVNSLVRSAFLLENKNESELVTLADFCTESLINKSMVKEGLAPVAIVGIVAGAAALLGGAYYFMYGATSAQNVYINSKKVLEALQPLMDKPYAVGIQTDVSNLMRMAEEVYALKDQLSSVQSVDIAVDVAKSAEYQDGIKNINEKIVQYINQLQKIYQIIPSWVGKIQMVHSTTQEEKSDWWAKLTGLTDPLWNTDYETLIDSLYGQSSWVGKGQSGGLYEAIKNDLKIMSAALQAGKQQAQQKVQEIEVIPTIPEKPEANELIISEV